MQDPKTPVQNKMGNDNEFKTVDNGNDGNNDL